VSVIVALARTPALPGNGQAEKGRTVQIREFPDLYSWRLQSCSCCKLLQMPCDDGRTIPGYPGFQKSLSSTTGVNLMNKTLILIAGLAIFAAGCSDDSATVGEKVDSAIDATKEAASDAADATRDAASSAAEATGDAYDATRDAVSREVEAMGEAVDAAREAYTESKAESAEAPDAAAEAAGDAADEAADATSQAAGQAEDAAAGAMGGAGTAVQP
jgi:hypothetical protein